MRAALALAWLVAAALPAAARAQPAPGVRGAGAAVTADDEDDADDEGDDSDGAGPGIGDDDSSSKPVDVHAAGDEAARILADPAYRFCHEARFPLRADEAEWCSLAKEARCPALREACEHLDANKQQSRFRLDDGGLLGSLAMLTFWGIILALVGVLVLLVARLVAGGGLFFADAAPSPTASPSPEVVAFAAHEPERDVARLLAAARVAADAGEHARAIDLVYAALLRHLEGAGLVRVRRDRTNGDYVRALRKRPEVQAVLREMVVAVERVQFGGEPPSADRYATLLARVTALVSRPLALLLLALGLAVSGCSGDRGPADDAPAGRSALRRLLQQHELRLIHRVAPVERLDASTHALIVTVPLTDAQWGKISDWVEGGRTVLVAHDGTPAERLGLHARSGRSHELRVDHRWHDKFGDLLPRLPGRRCLDPGKDTLLIADEHDCAYLTLREAGKGWWIFAADDQLFSNAALAFGDNAALLLDLCQNLGAKEIELVDETTGVAATSPVGSLLAGGLGAVLLQLGLVALLLCAHRGVAFGTRMDPPMRQRREFAEHVRAIGMQYWKARAYRYALAVYGAWAVERLRARVHMPAGDVARLAAALAARSGEPAEHIRQLLAAVATARQDVDGSAYGGEQATMAELFRLLHKVRGNR